MRKDILGVLALASRGRYQFALVEGRARWSGSDLRGRAREYAGRYARSRRALLARILALLPGHRAAQHQDGRLVRCAIVRESDGAIVAVIG